MSWEMKWNEIKDDHPGSQLEPGDLVQVKHQYPAAVCRDPYFVVYEGKVHDKGAKLVILTDEEGNFTQVIKLTDQAEYKVSVFKRMKVLADEEQSDVVAV